jgi:hypothetical protein
MGAVIKSGSYSGRLERRLIIKVRHPLRRQIAVDQAAKRTQAPPPVMARPQNFGSGATTEWPDATEETCLHDVGLALDKRWRSRAAN